MKVCLWHCLDNQHTRLGCACIRSEYDNTAKHPKDSVFLEQYSVGGIYTTRHATFLAKRGKVEAVLWLAWSGCSLSGLISCAAASWTISRKGSSDTCNKAYWFMSAEVLLWDMKVFCLLGILVYLLNFHVHVMSESVQVILVIGPAPLSLSWGPSMGGNPPIPPPLINHEKQVNSSMQSIKRSNRLSQSDDT